LTIYDASNKEELNDFFVEYIIKQRRHLGLSQSDIARATGLAPKTVSYIEAKKKLLSLWELFSICRVLQEKSSNTISVLSSINCPTCPYKKQVLSQLQPNVSPAKTGLTQFVQFAPISEDAKKELLDVFSYVIQNVEIK